MMRLSQLSYGLAMALATGQGVFAGPAVNVGMKAAFPASPYLLEVLETAAAENESLYFPMLDRISMGLFSSAVTEAQMYTSFISVLQADRHITDPEELSTFNMALSLRTASPRIEAHYQYYESSVGPVAGDVEDCLNWVLFDGNRYCSPDMLKPVNIDWQLPETVDVPFERTMGSGKGAVLYADPTSASFGPFHSALSAAAKRGELRYHLRYRRSPGTAPAALPVSGYAVELALKRTDYIVIDDREAEQDDGKKVTAADVDLDDDEEVADLKPLSTSELEGLGLKAASFVMQNEDPLEALVKLTQDLPKFTTSIASHEISPGFAQEHRTNRLKLAPAGVNNLWMNGVKLIERQIDPFTLVDMVRRERTFLRGVRSLGFSGKQALSLLGHGHVAAAKSGAGTPRYDWTDRSEDGKVIIWMNDLENDEDYADYPTTLDSLLQRMYPGQLPPIRRNLFHLVFPLDLSNADDLYTVSQIGLMVSRRIPIRFGIVPLVSEPKAADQAKIAYHLLQDYGIQAFIQYLGELQESSTDSSQKLLETVVKDYSRKPDASEKSFGSVMDSDYTQQLGLARQWARRLGASTESRIVLANGIVAPRNKNWMQAVSVKVTEDLQTVQKGVFQGRIDEDTWLPGIFLEHASSSRNAYIIPENEKALKFLDVNRLYSGFSTLFDSVPVLQGSAESSKDEWAMLTVIADLESPSGRELLVEALKFKRNSAGIRLDVVPNPHSSQSAFKLNAALLANQQKLESLSTPAELESILEQKAGQDENPTFRTALDEFLSTSKIRSGEQVLLLNGRIIGPISPDDSFKEDSFQELFKFEHANRIKPVYAALEELGLSGRITTPIAVAKVTSLTALSTISDLPEGIFESSSTLRSSVYDEWESKHTAIETGDPESSSVHIVGLLNPLSEQGQRWAPIIKVLSELEGVYVKLFLNPRENLTELPVKRFFHYVLDSAPSFAEDGSLKFPNATFRGLPSEALLTVGMNVPPAWLVAPKASAHDLDNIKLSTAKGDVEALYELEHILIEGHSRQTTGSIPRGAQLVLGTDSTPLVTDTIIMANLGYFQFKANPGYYSIKLKEGRSTEIYTIDSIGAQGWEPVPGDEGTHVSVMDFQGTTLYPRLRRRSGMDAADVLEGSDDSEDSILSAGLKFAGSLFGGNKGSASDREHAEINIFSVASGHLYERMLNIMMVSVMRNTKHTVKFWFIEQFLSPSFKEFIPHMAAEYGFKYEMVTYKWPHWLRHQREKQREIWGYKILFLDVLFPLSLDKVIFVDADQIVRTDMMDLVEHDLEGAPYGFVPMGDSRTEMEGFRFWKQGYWASFLRGRPYHISALYVVDLKRFRRLAAGDILRQQYHSLSADPNSLSNLDQDLPNNMQFRIPIHTLPDEWLWCETWCSDESLATARTIDLCNNPQTKEPKLDRARRQVPEWTIYDDEITVLARRSKHQAPAQDATAVHHVNTMSRRLDDWEDHDQGSAEHTRDEL